MAITNWVLSSTYLTYVSCSSHWLVADFYMDAICIYLHSPNPRKGRHDCSHLQCLVNQISSWGIGTTKDLNFPRPGWEGISKWNQILQPFFPCSLWEYYFKYKYPLFLGSQGISGAIGMQDSCFLLWQIGFVVKFEPPPAVHTFSIQPSPHSLTCWEDDQFSDESDLCSRLTSFLQLSPATFSAGLSNCNFSRGQESGQIMITGGRNAWLQFPWAFM